MTGDFQVKIGYVAVDMDNSEAEQFVLFRKHYLQFKKFIDHGVFEQNYTGRVVIDIKDGRIKEFDKNFKCHYDN